MSEREIKFERETNFTGRNGFFKCSGLNVLDISDNRIMIAPLTSRGEVARCDISIPKENIPDVAKSLLGVHPCDDLYIFTERERDTIIAALRLYQDRDIKAVANDWGRFDALQDIATNGGKHDALDENEIDILIEDKINKTQTEYIFSDYGHALQNTIGGAK